MLRETEDELIVAAQEGNIIAFERLLRPLETQLLSLAAGFALRREDADDIYQEAMLSAFRAIAGFKGESRFSTWLHRIVVNTALSYKRQMLRRGAREEELPDDGGVMEQYGRSPAQPEHGLLSYEFNSRLNHAMRLLSPNERMAFVLCHQQEFRIEEAAAVMDCSGNSVKVHVFRARRKLQKELAPLYQQLQQW